MAATEGTADGDVVDTTVAGGDVVDESVAEGVSSIDHDAVACVAGEGADVSAEETGVAAGWAATGGGGSPPASGTSGGGATADVPPVGAGAAAENDGIHDVGAARTLAASWK